MNGLRFGLFLLALASFACSGSSTSGTGDGTGGSSGSGTGTGSGTGSGSGSGSGSVGDALFQTPSSTTATPDSIFGLWGGSLENQGFTFDTRVKLTSDTMTFAQKCSTADGMQGGIASVLAKARVSNDDVTVLESKSDQKMVGSVTCRASTSPGETKRCAPEDKGFESHCFELDGTSLTLFGDTAFDKLALTKISD